MDELVKEIMQEEIRKLLARNRAELVKRVHKKVRQLQQKAQDEQTKLS